MKKLTILLFALLAYALPAFAQFPYFPGNQTEFKQFSFAIKEHSANRTAIQLDTLQVGGGGVAADTLWDIRMTHTDTSRIYLSAPYMSLWYKWTEPAADSVHLKIRFYMAAESNYNPGKIPGFTDFALIDSLTITRDGNQEMANFWVLTDGSPALPNARWWYIRVTGLAQNDKATGVTGRLRMSNYSDLPR